MLANWLKHNCRFSSPQDLSSWLAPDGTFHSLDATSHMDWVSKAFPGSTSLHDAWSKGWLRITYIGRSLYAHNDLVMPTQSQKKVLEDLAISNKMEEVVLDHDGREAVIWSSKNMM